MNPRLHILFVDDDPNLLQALQRSLRPMRKNWDMEFADGGASALALLERSEFDVVVSDMKMPGINGCDLLDRVLASHPGTLRFILSGHAEQSQLMQCIGPTHQFLSKPCETGKLTASLQRVHSLEHLVSDSSLRHWLAHLDRLPCNPDHLQSLLKLLEHPDTSIESVATLIAKDPGMATLILKLANSAFFGSARGTMDISLATIQLGIDVIRSLSQTLHLLTPLDAGRCPSFDSTTVWQRSQRAASILRRIAEQDSTDQITPNDAYSLGLLLDVGKLALCTRRQQSATSEQDSFTKHTFAHAGAYLLGMWGFPEFVVEAVACQHASKDVTVSSFKFTEAVQFTTSMLDDAGSMDAQSRAAAHPSWLKIFRETMQ